MKDNRNPLASAIRYALGASVVAGLAATAAPVAAQDQDEEDVADLGRQEVTGSRISRADIEGALPITVIDREQIEFSGQNNVMDLLRDLPFTTAGSFRPQSGSTGQSFAGVNLRALGSARTLILIDGRRAPTAPNIGNSQDVRAIPLAAVERIEILSDGASAVYGSEAIGGVVNIITRKDFTGAEITAGFGRPTEEGGDTEQASAIIGVAGDRGSIMMGVAYDERDIIFARDREWSRGGASTFSNNFLTTGGAFLDIPGRGSANVPGCTGPGFTVGSTRCFYDFTFVSADEAASRNESLFTRANYEITDNWNLYLNASASRVKSFGRYAPVPSSPWLVNDFRAIELIPGTPNHPGTRPEDGGLNPDWELYQDFADETLTMRHRFAANGPRDTSTDAQLYDIDLGAQGRIGNFDVDFGARRTESQYTEVGRNYIVAALAQEQFDSGAYNIYDPFGVSDDVLGSFTATIGRDANFLAKEAYASASTEVFDLPNGPVGVAFGAEYREEDYRDIFDDLQANNNITGSSGSSAFGGREIWSAFGEVLIPILENLELSAAARYDDYSDFGDAFSPKVALRYQPLETLTFRASYGEGFRAPPLDILSQQPSFSADSVTDIPTAEFLGVEDPNDAIQITGFTIANPDLGAEESEQFGIGAAFEPLEWLSGSVDYFNIEISDRVANISAQTIINCLNGSQTNCPPGLTQFDPNLPVPDPSLGLGLARGPGGNIVFLQRGSASLGTLETSGFDINLRSNFDFGNLGRITNDVQGTYTMEYIIDGGDNVAGSKNAANESIPRWRAGSNTVWAIGDFAISWNMNYTSRIDRAIDTSDFDGLESWITHDLQFNWYAPWNGQITFGADNIANRDPVLDAGEGDGYDFDLYDAYGRVWYFRYTQRF